MDLTAFLRSVFAILLAFVMSSFVYFGFTNSYSTSVLNHAAFQHQFHEGIYQYRILGSYLLSAVYDALGSFKIDYSIFKIKFLQADSEPRMYIAFYVLNTVFLMLAAFVISRITESKYFAATPAEKILITATAIFTLALSQFVIVPYDMVSIFLLALFFYLLMAYLKKNSVALLLAMCATIVLATLTRESSALMLSLAAAVMVPKYGLKKETITLLLILTAMFVGVYGGVRLWNQSFTTNDGNLLKQNFEAPKNILGLLFWLVFLTFTLLLAKDHSNRRLILTFHVFALPYLIVCLYTGILYEIRLYVPLFIISLLLSRTELAKVR